MADEFEQAPFEPIAIIGVSALLPDAPDAATFWRNVLSGHVSIREVPSERWNVADFWVEGAPKNVDENKTYAKIGAWVDDFEFDWRRWRQPPGTLPQIDMCQLWAVATSAAALEDAGYLGEGAARDLPNARTGVIFANALGGENRNLSNHRVWADQFARKAVEAGMPEANREALKAALTDGLPKVDEDTMPGELANVVAGRVANLLDLQGPNYTTDAACATTFAAVLDACRLLQARQVDMMLAGAADRTMDPATFAKFSAIGALSPSHSTPFDAAANGFVMGEGAGCIVLKRLTDAVRDGDAIQAVIRGVGASSDGRGKGITAPSQRGQIQAVRRAYAQAGYGPETVDLIEAHGTSTIVGDATELGSLAQAFSGVNAGEHVAVGSIKSQIGHLKAAAGMAGLLKAVHAVREGIIPPSAGFSAPNTNVDWSNNPFYVPTTQRPWSAASHPRRAGISAFGFGGTNFHCAIESHDANYHAGLASEWEARHAAWLNPGKPQRQAAPEAAEQMSWAEMKAVEGGILLLNASTLDALKAKIASTRKELFAGENFDDSPNGKRLSHALPAASADFTPTGVRCAVVASDWAQLAKRLDMLESMADDRSRWPFLAKQMVLISDAPTLPPEAKVAHMYPGQGSQYVGMTLDLAKRYGCISRTWEEADETMVEILDGERLSTFVLRENLSDAEKKDAESKLKRTEYTQPAMLTADLALYRLLKDHGLEPDMVAGHSLGEYAALMVSGILQFHDALRAAAARGTEMGSVDVPDQGIMASVSAPYAQIQAVLDAEPGYVIAANKNSPKMTVIAGETEPMKRVMKVFEEAGAPCVQLATSHAFHSRIVAPANEPLRRFLEGLEINLPAIPITANVDGGWYPNEAEDGKAAILEKLAPQMSSAVEWTEQVRTMHASGARMFVEVGPKRALALFAEQILEDEPAKVVTNTNHPKVGGVASFHFALAMHAMAGRLPTIPGADADCLTPAFRAPPREACTEAPQVAEESVVEMSEEERIIAQIQAKEAALSALLAKETGFPARMFHGATNLVTIGCTPQTIERIQQAVASRFRTKSVDRATLTTLPSLVDWLDEDLPIRIQAPAQTKQEQQTTQVVQVIEQAAPARPEIVVSGVSLGLPGMAEVFAPDALDRIIAGENFISELPEAMKQRLLDKNLVRIVKKADGSADFVPCDSFDLIPQLAGVGGHFDLAEQYGIDPKIVGAMDIATKLAFAAGLEAMADAALPLLPVEQTNKAGKRLISAWNLPERERDRTGVIFASVFPGVAQAMRHAQNAGADENGTFDRRFLLQVLSMGHSQFAQWIGARGPNLAINNACASAPAAFAIAEDWMAQGRCDRVIIVSGDDSTGEDLMEWVGAGFAAAGAHAMGNVVEEVALPFDARRSGMLLGMGGAAFVLERTQDADDRGVVPYVQVLGAHIGNSAFHPTRLEVNHVATSLDNFVGEMEARHGIDRHAIAPKMTFMSHEPATPPRGGSAAAEIQALRTAFGASANKIIITNTKGFTGHPMGVGIEDAVVIRGLAQGELPPIANFRQPDPELGDLRLSTGGPADVEYGLRHAAGFGSQMALTMLKRVARSLDRVDAKKLNAWTRAAANGTVELRMLERKLVGYVDADSALIGGVNGSPVYATESPSAPAPVVEEKPVAVAPSGDIEAKVVEVVVKHTGYPADFVELDQDLEGELGIDTVKQAEIMAELRDHFGLPVDESFVLSDHPTLNHMIAYLGDGAPAAAEIPKAPVVVQEVEAPAPVAPSGNIEAKVVEVVVKHTGYPEDFIELDQDLEGELGIDTVKQAEIMAELRDHFGLPVDESFVLADHPTLNHMIAYLGDGAPPEPVEVEVTQAPAPVAPSGDIEAKVIEVVVKHTGYPDDFIELDQDLEGELGIDTVKQAEIMAELRDHFGLPVDESFVLADHPTLNHMIAYLDQGEAPQPVVVEAPEPEPVVEDIPVLETGVRRWQVEVEEAPAVAAEALNIEDKVIAVTDDAWGVADRLCHILEAAGIETARIMLDPSIVSKVKVEKDGPVDIFRVNPGNAEQLASMGDRLAEIGDVRALIHLAPLRLAGVGWDSETQQAHLESTTHGLFGLLKSLDAHFAGVDDAAVVSVTAMDGRHGCGGARFNALAAGAHGVVKSYAREHPHLRARAVDIDPDWLTDPDALCNIIWAEVFGRTEPREVGIARDGTRWGLKLYAEDLPEENRSLASDDVWVVSGGGSGVTASCVIGVAEASTNANAAFVLLGRTKLDASLEEWLHLSEDELSQEKMKLREALASESETGKVTIVEWETAWQRKMRSVDIHRTLHAIRSTGNQAFYDACDVTNVKSVSKVFDGIRSQCGPITGIVHGAGMEDSKLVADKSWDTFSKVVSVKIDGWRALVDAAGDDLSDLRVLCAFTSVAGRFGNGGQTDYAAANNILDAEMSRIAAHEDAPRAVAIAWSGWRDVGMATRGSIEAIFEAAGIEMIPVEGGVQIFVDEMLGGGKRRVVAAGALGSLDDESSTRDAPQRLAEDTQRLLEDPRRFPFIDRVIEQEPYSRIISECTLSEATHPFLTDHSIDGTPYHPGVMALEMFAQNALLLYPMATVSGFTGVKFGLPVKLVKETQKVRIVSEFSDADEDHLHIRCRLESDLVNKAGQVFGEPRLHHEATVLLLKDGAERDPFQMPFAGRAASGGASFQPPFIYERFFHGPRFQAHGGLVKGVRDGEDYGADGIALLRSQLPATDLFVEDASGNPMLLEALPMLIEACFQNAGLVAMEVDGFSSLPVGIEATHLLRTPAAGEDMRVRSIRREMEGDGITRHDAIVFDGEGRPVVVLEGLRLKAMAPVEASLQFKLTRKP